MATDPTSRGPDPVPEALDPATHPPAQVASEARTWGMLCHLSALVCALLGGMTFIGPLVCWLLKRDSSPFVDYHGKEALNFQLNILIYALASIPLFFLCGIGLVVLIVVGIVGLILPIIAGVKANSGEYYRYPLTFRIIQ